MTRKQLARDSGVSERYLAQIESRQRKHFSPRIAAAGQGIEHVRRRFAVRRPGTAVELVHTVEFLRRLSSDDLKLAQQYVAAAVRRVDPAARHRRIALIGLRGAGKSTLGAALAERFEMPFLELDRLIEQESGLTLRPDLRFSWTERFPPARTAVSGKCNPASSPALSWRPEGVLYPSRGPLNDCYPVASRSGCEPLRKNTCSA